MNTSFLLLPGIHCMVNRYHCNAQVLGVGFNVVAWRLSVTPVSRDRFGALRHIGRPVTFSLN